MSTRSTCSLPLALASWPCRCCGRLRDRQRHPDAAREPYRAGAAGSAKAALEQLTAVLAAEHPQLGVYTFDPGDMRTALQQEAFPGEDISDRPEPEVAAAALLRLLGERPPSGRYRASDYPATGLERKPAVAR